MKRFKTTPLTPEEFNKIYLEYEPRFNVVEGTWFDAVKSHDVYRDTKMFHYEAICREYLSFKVGDKVYNYSCRRDGLTDGLTDVLNKWQYFNRHVYKVPHIGIENKQEYSAVPLLVFNRKWNDKQWHNCIGYDLNNAYGAILAYGILPDTSIEVQYDRVVKDDEIGFYIKSDGNIDIALPGTYALWVWPQLKGKARENIKKYALRNYEMKLKGEEILRNNPNDPEGLKLKDEGKLKNNIIVGYFQKYNWPLRAAVVCACNERILNTVGNKKSWFYTNTDSIYLIEDCLPEELIGDELGKFKVEKIGRIRGDGHKYQWEGEKPVWKGVSKCRIGDDFDFQDDYELLDYPWRFDIKKGMIKNEKQETKIN